MTTRPIVCSAEKPQAPHRHAKIMNLPALSCHLDELRSHAPVEAHGILERAIQDLDHLQEA